MTKKNLFYRWNCILKVVESSVYNDVLVFFWFFRNYYRKFQNFHDSRESKQFLLYDIDKNFELFDFSRIVSLFVWKIIFYICLNSFLLRHERKKQNDFSKINFFFEILIKYLIFFVCSSLIINVIIWRIVSLFERCFFIFLFFFDSFSRSDVNIFFKTSWINRFSFIW